MNDEVYQYQEWEMQQDVELQELLDNYVDADIIEEFISTNSKQREEFELFSMDIVQQNAKHDIMITFGVCIFVFAIATIRSLMY